ATDAATAGRRRRPRGGTVPVRGCALRRRRTPAHRAAAARRGGTMSAGMGTATVVACLVIVAFAVAGPRLARRLPPAAATRVGVPGSLVVLDNDRPDAFATPGARGRIVVTRGLLRALNADERRALLAHETAHLAHRHACWLLVAELAAAANPMLTPTARAVRH